MQSTTTIPRVRRSSQFNLRGVLLGSLPLAIFFALLGAVYRQSSADVRWILAEGGALCAMVFGLGLFVQFQLRLAARHAAGREILCIKSSKNKRTPVVLAASALLLSLHASIGVVPWDARSREHVSLVVAGVPAVLCFFVYVLFWFDRFDLEVCRHGLILNGLWYRAWREVTGHRWSRDAPSTVELQFGASRHSIFVPPEQIAEVDELLARLSGTEPGS